MWVAPALGVWLVDGRGVRAGVLLGPGAADCSACRGVDGPASLKTASWSKGPWPGEGTVARLERCFFSGPSSMTTSSSEDLRFPSSGLTSDSVLNTSSDDSPSEGLGAVAQASGLPLPESDGPAASSTCAGRTSMARDGPAALSCDALGAGSSGGLCPSPCSCLCCGPGACDAP